VLAYLLASEKMNNKKIPLSLTLVVILLSCFGVMTTGSAQTSQNMPPPDFNGNPPPGWNGDGNMTIMPPPDFNGSSGFGNGGMPMPDFNGTMPRPSGNPGDFNAPFNPQAADNQTDYSVYAIAVVAVVVIVVAVIVVLLIQKRKPHPTAPMAS
jgi:hypothetical protein